MISMDLSLPRGIRDIDPDEYELHHRIRTAFDELVRAYNFRSMEPAPLETLSVLRAKSGGQVDDQIYHFKDKGDRDIGLRFDLTVGMTRYVAGKKGLRPRSSSPPTAGSGGTTSRSTPGTGGSTSGTSRYSGTRP